MVVFSLSSRSNVYTNMKCFCKHRNIYEVWQGFSKKKLNSYCRLTLFVMISVNNMPTEYLFSTYLDSFHNLRMARSWQIIKLPSSRTHSWFSLMTSTHHFLQYNTLSHFGFPFGNRLLRNYENRVPLHEYTLKPIW